MKAAIFKYAKCFFFLKYRARNASKVNMGLQEIYGLEPVKTYLRASEPDTVRVK